MINKHITIAISGLLLLFNGYCQPIDLSRAKVVAEGFMQIQSIEKGNYTISNYSIENTFPIGFNDQNLFYLINFSPKGFVIVTADLRAVPILGYSFDSNIDPQNMSPALKNWLKGYKQQLHLLTRYLDDNTKHHPSWAQYLDEEFPKPNSITISQGRDPLLRSNWEQGNYYNYDCPLDPNGPGGHVYAGCVAVSMAQLMYYYRYPVSGTGSISYVSSSYGIISADFENSEFHWNEMVNQIFGMPNPAIADLIFKSAASIKTQFGAYASGSYLFFVETALKEYFRYDSSSLSLIHRSSTSDQWKDTIIYNLDKLLPVLYSGGSAPNIHSFVCDGYDDTSYFHFNFGWWNGSGNGYYHIDNINPYNYNYNHNETAIINIYPGDGYPQYASDIDTLTAPRGSFEDGSGHFNYLSNTNGYWLIEAEEGAYIMLYFDLFDTKEEDILTVYDGESTNSPILGVFSGTDIPEALTSGGNRMLIHFSSNNEDNAPGWYAHYISVLNPFCLEWRELTDTSGHIYDGSGQQYNYVDNSDCIWYIHPQGHFYDSIAAIEIEIVEIDTEEDKDLLTIYGGSSLEDPIVEVLSGSDYQYVVNVNNNEALINFTSDESNTKTGFLANYKVILPVYCEDTMIISENSGTISDGSTSKLYNNKSNCYWLIESIDRDTIYLTFTEFDLEYGYDWVEVLDPEYYPPSMLGHYTGNQLPPQIKGNNGKLLIHFYTDQSIAKTGWEAIFTTDYQNVDENRFINSVTIRPNPIRETLYVDIDCKTAMNIDVELLSMEGNHILHKPNFLFAGKNTIALECSNLPAGIYILKLFYGTSSDYYKLVIL